MTSFFLFQLKSFVEFRGVRCLRGTHEAKTARVIGFLSYVCSQSPSNWRKEGLKLVVDVILTQRVGLDRIGLEGKLSKNIYIDVLPRLQKKKAGRL